MHIFERFGTRGSTNQRFGQSLKLNKRVGTVIAIFPLKIRRSHLKLGSSTAQQLHIYYALEFRWELIVVTFVNIRSHYNKDFQIHGVGPPLSPTILNSHAVF